MSLRKNITCLLANIEDLRSIAGILTIKPVLIPDSPAPLLAVMQEVDAWLAFKKANPRNKRGDTEERVAVVSCDGVARIGVYCTAAHR